MASSPTPTRPASEQPRAHRSWSVPIARVAGIPIYLHFTFLLLLGWIAAAQVTTGQRVFGGVLFITSVFVSVALHELGHAMMARFYGIRTEDIVLYPFGGVARLHSLGEGWQEFWIALAGPAVNLLIVIGIAAILSVTGQWATGEIETAVAQSGGGADVMIRLTFLHKLAIVNLLLLVFNMIPAFPMDGGRVLRAILASRMPKARATRIAARIGQGFAILFMLTGVTGNPLLFIVGLFVFLAAGQEAVASQSISLMSGHTVRDAMITRFETLNHGQSLGHAAQMLLATNQHEFPVIGGSEVIGVLTRKDLITGLASLGRDHIVAEAMRREFPRIAPHLPLHAAFDGLRQARDLPLLVFDGDQLVGYVTQENLGEYLMVAQARAAAPAPA